MLVWFVRMETPNLHTLYLLYCSSKDIGYLTYCANKSTIRNLAICVRINFFYFCRRGGSRHFLKNLCKPFLGATKKYTQLVQNFKGSSILGWLGGGKPNTPSFTKVL